MSNRLSHRATHWKLRPKGNRPWKWFMDKAMILKKKYQARTTGDK